MEKYIILKEYSGDYQYLFFGEYDSFFEAKKAIIKEILYPIDEGEFYINFEGGDLSFEMFKQYYIEASDEYGFPKFKIIQIGKEMNAKLEFSDDEKTGFEQIMDDAREYNKILEKNIIKNKKLEYEMLKKELKDYLKGDEIDE